MSEEIKPTKLDGKRLDQQEERRRRLVNRGIPVEKIDEVIQREDYERLPMERKVERLEKLLAGYQKSIAQDLMALQANQMALFHTMDVNFTAFEMILAKLGVTPEQQKEAVLEAQKIIDQKQEAARKASEEKANAQAVEGVGVPGEPPTLPEGASVFGG